MSGNKGHCLKTQNSKIEAISEAYTKLSQASKMEPFTKIVNG